MKTKIQYVIKFVSLIVGVGGGLFLYPVCSRTLELANGNMTHMQCYYMGKVGGILLICICSHIIDSLVFKAPNRLVSFSLGVLMLLITISSPIFDGPCANLAMACHQTAYCFRASGILYLLSECMSIIMKEK